MMINGVTIDDTFAEAFPMKATRLIITAMTMKYAYRAANSLTGFASSVIACGCEADIERELKPEETPDGRPGVAIIMFAMSKSQLADQLTRRVGQSVMTTATSACFAGTHSDTMLPLGKSLRYFGDGHQFFSSRSSFLWLNLNALIPPGLTTLTAIARAAWIVQAT